MDVNTGHCQAEQPARKADHWLLSDDQYGPHNPETCGATSTMEDDDESGHGFGQTSAGGRVL